MRPLLHLYQPCRFGTNVWRYPPLNYYLPPRHLSASAHFYYPWPPQDPRCNFNYYAQQNAVLPNHLLNNRPLHVMSMDQTAGKDAAADNGNISQRSKRTFSMMTSTGDGIYSTTPLLNCSDRSRAESLCKLLHAGASTSDLSELDANKTNDAADAEKCKQDAAEEKIEHEMIVKRYLDLRKWHRVQRNDPFSDGQQEFYLVSYNILAQQLLETNGHLYQDCDPEILNWPYRRGMLFNELKNLDGDIVCLQEMQEDHYYQDVSPFLTREGYDSIYKKRTGNKNDGCAIFFKRDNFELEKWVPVEYNKPGIPVLNRDNIGIVALFRPKAAVKKNTSARLCVATTHLLFNPKRGDVKLAQLQVLLAEIDKMAFRRLGCAGKARYHPVVLCGDMNSEPHCDIYSFVSTGMLNYEGLPVATMSGQKRSSNTWCLSSELLPRWLGITDECQYSHSLRERNHELEGPRERVVGSPSSKAASNVGATSSENGTSSNNVDNATFDVEEEPFCSGSMLHNLNLTSVYKHELERLPGVREVTTQHSKASCTVDYIFYSVTKKSYAKDGRSGEDVVHDVKENRLKLLAYYGLLSHSELRQCRGLPNAFAASDHLPLAAKFSLKL